SALLNHTALASLLGNGLLGKLLPAIFGQHSQGGIVGRPQHGGHEFPVDEHSLHVVNAVREHPDFASLSRKDQVNLLWAAFMHDIGKQAGRKDPDHEWASANLAWGVLRTLGYSPQRVQRIINLISRHGEMSFIPEHPSSERLKDEPHVQSLAVFYRHPSASKQLAILNEADIRSISHTNNHWSPEVQAQLKHISRTIGARSRQINQASVPLLTSQLPDRFGLVQMTGDYALLAHASPHIEGAFLEQLSTIESPEFSASTSLFTPNHRRLYYEDVPIVALVTAPQEHVSQAHRSNLGTGRGVDWKGHVELTTSWTEASREKDFVSELNTRVRRFGLTSGQNGNSSTEALHELWRRLSQFDTLDELQAQHGCNSEIYQAYQETVRALTTEENGRPLNQHNEVKLNNPTLVGLGILRRGRSVYFEGLESHELLQRLLNGQRPPTWLVTDSTKPEKAVVVSPQVWQAALQRNIPLVVLE
ncbi:MAG: HD domain-containing protein, partial [Candidatus Melainabacteria bacterium]|nr:HD domain-containing protein [Candidatus Melainabacteria bacterium]